MTEFVKHDGTGCPLALGTRYEVKNRKGETWKGAVEQVDLMVTPFVFNGMICISAWAWSIAVEQGPFDGGQDVMEYRVIDRESDAKASRSEMFREWLKPARETEDA